MSTVKNNINLDSMKIETNSMFYVLTNITNERQYPLSV